MTVIRSRELKQVEARTPESIQQIIVDAIPCMIGVTREQAVMFLKGVMYMQKKAEYIVDYVVDLPSFSNTIEIAYKMTADGTFYYTPLRIS